MSQAPWWERLLRASTPDLLGALVEQSRLSREAIAALDDWSRTGDGGVARRIGDLEHEADAARRTLVDGLRTVLASPVNQENLYVLSERCDRVVNAAKNLVHQATTLGWAPDRPAADMAACIHEAMDALGAGIDALEHDQNRAAELASDALKASRHVEHVYRNAMAALANATVSTPDLRQVLCSWEMYRRYAETGVLVAATADRLWFLVLAEG